MSDFIFDIDSLIIRVGSTLSINNKGIQIKNNESNKEKAIQFISLVISLSKYKNVIIEKLNKDFKSKKIFQKILLNKYIINYFNFCQEKNNIISIGCGA